jgi:mercuric ion binding protein
MNRFILIICVVAFPWALFAGNLETVVLDVKNMACTFCPITVKKALQRVPGITIAEVDLDKKTARVTFDPVCPLLPSGRRCSVDNREEASVNR